jgi:hypothetical protein
MTEIAVALEQFRAGLRAARCPQCDREAATTDVDVTARAAPWLAMVPKLDRALTLSKAVRVERGTIRLCAACAARTARAQRVRENAVFVPPALFVVLAVLDAFGPIHMRPGTMIAVALALGVGLMLALSRVVAGGVVEGVRVASDHVVLRGSAHLAHVLRRELPAAAQVADG